MMKRLNRFPDSVLVAGCQRSGTPILSRVMPQSDGMVIYWFGRNDELDAALILSGEVNHESDGWNCFQMAYLNECHKGYFQHVEVYKPIRVH